MGGVYARTKLQIKGKPPYFSLGDGTLIWTVWKSVLIALGVRSL